MGRKKALLFNKVFSLNSERMLCKTKQTQLLFSFGITLTIEFSPFIFQVFTVFVIFLDKWNKFAFRKGLAAIRRHSGLTRCQKTTWGPPANGWRVEHVERVDTGRRFAPVTPWTSPHPTVRQILDFFALGWSFWHNDKWSIANRLCAAGHSFSSYSVGVRIFDALFSSYELIDCVLAKTNYSSSPWVYRMLRIQRIYVVVLHEHECREVLWHKKHERWSLHLSKVCCWIRSELRIRKLRIFIVDLQPKKHWRHCFRVFGGL